MDCFCAFQHKDRVWHEGFLYKLIALDISIEIIKLNKSFFID